MSAQQTLSFCLDYWMLDYGVPDKNGVFTRDSGSPTHWDHALHVFGAPDDYPAPIRGVLASLSAGLPVSDGRIALFSLAIAINALQPTNGRSVTSSHSAQADDLGIPTLFDVAIARLDGDD